MRKKPVEVEAWQLTEKNKDEIVKKIWKSKAETNTYISDGIIIKTLEGSMFCGFNDWIIKGVNGEFYPIKNDIFEKTYEIIGE